MGYLARFLVATLFIGSWVAERATAQPDPSLDPTFGSVTLKAGFAPDPFKKELKAGGRHSTNLGGVNANVAKAPDFRLEYTKGNRPLTFAVNSMGDTTLLIRLPDGTWAANADGLRGQIKLKAPESGRYDIYLGSIGKDTLDATLVIAEKPLAPLVGKGNLPDCYLVSAGVDNYAKHAAGRLNGCLTDARDLTAVFRAQQGTTFRRVEAITYLDESARRAAIIKRYQNFTKQGNPGDYMVLILSSHGGKTEGDRIWHFIPHDFDALAGVSSAITDDEILETADVLVKQKKKVVIIVDCCFCGLLKIRGKAQMDRYKDLKEGGLVLMLASGPAQESNAMGKYSAFARAVTESLRSQGDLNKDGKITLGEIRAYSTRRTSQILTEAMFKQKQDSTVDWAGAFSQDTVLADARTLAPPGSVKFEMPKLPRGFGKAKWDVKALEDRFSIVGCAIDEETLVFELDLKDNIVQPLKCTLVLTDEDGVKTLTTVGVAMPETGRQGARIQLIFRGVFFSSNRNAWAKAINMKIVVE